MPEEEENVVINMGAPEWVVTFGDLMSLLLCFFVLLLSFSETDKAKYKEVAGSLAKAFGVQYVSKRMQPPKGISIVAKDFDQELVPTKKREEFIVMANRKKEAERIAAEKRKEVGERLKREIEESLRNMPGGEEIGDLIHVNVGENEVTIQLMGETTFDSGKAEIKQEMLPLLKKIGIVLQEQTGDIIVMGHTDNVPIVGGRFKTNLALSMARAASVADFLINVTHIKPERVSTMGFGEYRPIETNDTPEGRQRNRRVEIKLKSSPVE
ncbi:MAG: type VI secretion system protein TssL [Deltaproteobacteria bacterium]|nr:MAG: type VI secretion system protein TssL [Deltaproteobacteria bacterium]